MTSGVRGGGEEGCCSGQVADTPAGGFTAAAAAAVSPVSALHVGVVLTAVLPLPAVLELAGWAQALADAAHKRTCSPGGPLRG